MSTARSIRRAAERRAQKLARKQAKLDFPNNFSEDVEPCDPSNSCEACRTCEACKAEAIESAEPPTGITQSIERIKAALSRPDIAAARLEANRANAQLSTGPKTDEGKAKSSKNAIRTALTGRTVLLPEDDAAQYEAHLAEYKKIYRPVGLEETQLVQALADTWWRLERIPGLISALYARGAAEGAGRIETYLHFERQFKNLDLQERRLFRQQEKLKAELRRLREERKEREAEELSNATQKDCQLFNPTDHGFEFSTAGVEANLEGMQARHIANQTVQNGELSANAIKTAA